MKLKSNSLFVHTCLASDFDNNKQIKETVLFIISDMLTLQFERLANRILATYQTEAFRISPLSSHKLCQWTLHVALSNKHEKGFSLAEQHRYGKKWNQSFSKWQCFLMNLDSLFSNLQPRFYQKNMKRHHTDESLWIPDCFSSKDCQSLCSCWVGGPGIFYCSLQSN